jgi:hypothetical protein
MTVIPLPPSHPDHLALQPVYAAILRQSGGMDGFSAGVPRLFRRAIDEVIDAPRTNRFTLSETEKTEKTYLGTKIEILLRNFLKISKGRILDLLVDGVEVDIKNTMGRSWTIPLESYDHPALLLRANETKARCDVGLILVRPEYLNPGSNRDAKRTISAASLSNIWWLLHNEPYPPNFWEMLPVSQRQLILAAGSGTSRIAVLFENIQRQPISRLQIQALAQQHDYMKRIRRNGGARDILAAKGIALLWGQRDKKLISQLNLGLVAADEFISFKPDTQEQIEILRAAKHID